MAKEKLRIIEEAENIGNRAAGRKNDVKESCICDWRKKTIRNLGPVVRTRNKVQITLFRG